MLLAIEGGGFFSSSASGYSNCISLFLLSQKSEEKPDRVAPWSQYQLVSHETDTHLELASRKNRRLFPGCTSFVCFGRAAAGPDSSPSHLKVGPSQNNELTPEGPGPASEKGEDIHSVEGTNTSTKLARKSSLKKPRNRTSHSGDSDNDCETVSEESNDAPDDHIERRVHWTDTHGGELFEVREFEPSDDESDDEYTSRNEKACSCKIM